MTTLEDTLSEDELESIEKAERRSKRSKTKYGDLLPEDDE
ncbi:hypothetical protein HJTV-2_gp124 [Haloarcula virus HJTV-2]|uniref:Uncharacterized protein n=5 Tax=Haloferacalesvirus TaxID=2843389 RepID=R4TF86_9CAUD|nr:hypothetical protein M192_gp018 [Halorubrum tailed phage 8]YP_010357721.1 hypothetical protein M1M33_gp023 [Haloarcula virus HJTV-2]YP_010358552.1 hypothetical protein M1M41_gp017 [Halorubrum sodomense tailed virus 4]UBF19187.1 hypothetical protein HRTV-14_gp114 [Halorubrum phage HRTV-14]UBF19315.1 hypothetical protein HRTV-17_gp116 [Halorubrum phage HRTV-17]UBF21604.1 hypothetical protein HRTV-24_gp118 [Halorubrum virus HRTV-24]UBF21873.1 hypothetical protein HSTV-3_gp113 [Halorubrum viru